LEESSPFAKKNSLPLFEDAWAFIYLQAAAELEKAPTTLPRISATLRRLFQICPSGWRVTSALNNIVESYQQMRLNYHHRVKIIITPHIYFKSRSTLGFTMHDT